ncbi:MAG: bifunctional phosphopantothenoylcysteine decarboxylase/phosphopantothenate--cysteine ligase CoaBC [Clostridia bacterium]
MKKTVVMGVTGSIAAYKACDIVSRLKKHDIDVHIILTRAGAEFITPLALETISGNPVITDMFNRTTPWEVEHVALAKQADVFLVAPASANFLAKASVGIADDMLLTTLLATHAALLIAPAMNSNMYQNAIVQQNMAVLRSRGAIFIQPGNGMLACGDTGIGRLAETDTIVETVLAAMNKKSDLLGMRIIVSAGPTQENIDPVRYITNRSSGKMGYAIAEAAQERGALVTLISGPSALITPHGVKRIDVVSSHDMFDAVNAEFKSCDVLIMAAAPADFTPEYSNQKIKKNGRDGLSIELAATQDILASVGKNKGNRILVGFAAETQDIAANAMKKLASKNLDMIAANDVSGMELGFKSDYNHVMLYIRDGSCADSGIVSKRELADWLLDRILKLNN